MARNVVALAPMGRLPWARAGLALLVLILVNAVLTPNFLTAQTLLLNLTQVAPIVIVVFFITVILISSILLLLFLFLS